MAQLVRDSPLDPAVRETAIEMLSAFRTSSKMDYIRAVEAFIRGRTVTVSEPDELLIDPARMIREANEKGVTHGDCDDISMVAASLIHAVGIPVRFKATFPASDGGYSHVFAEYNLGEGWRPFDLTIPIAPVHPPDFLTEEV